MPREHRFEIRFDDHGHILVEDPELARRIGFLLRNDGHIVVRLVGDQEDPGSTNVPNFGACLVDGADPLGDRPIRNGILCPNAMCVCGGLKLVRDGLFSDQYHASDSGTERH